MKNKSSKSGIQGENPPVLTGGLKPENLGMGKLINVSIDWLSVTVGDIGSIKLLSMSEFAEDGKPSKGFNRSEKRICIGGHCWRKWKPLQSEKKMGFGKDYESWEFSGGQSGPHLSALVGILCKPTRIDIAFDYAVDKTYFSDYWIEGVKSYLESKKHSIGVSGQDDVNTRYIGSSQSERRIRIYRKDLQDFSVNVTLGPVLRIELVLKDRYVKAFWKIFSESEQEAFRLAASYICDMSGFSPIPDGLEELPKIEKRMPSGAFKKLFHFIRQNAINIAAFKKAGLDWHPLAEYKHHLSQSNKVARHRYKSTEKELCQIDPEVLIKAVYDAFEGGL